jgi:hypothetical protein
VESSFEKKHNKSGNSSLNTLANPAPNSALAGSRSSRNDIKYKSIHSTERPSQSRRALRKK